jgi:RHS repeat-associated protein
MDAGERWMLANVRGKPIRLWESRGFGVVTSYDEIGRQIGVNVAGNSLNNVLAEKVIYGDSKQGAPAKPELTNSRGRIHQSCHSAGVVTNFGVNPITGQNEGYDFHGNLLRTRRQLPANYKNQVDWAQNPALQSETFTAFNRYDALSRTVQQVAPYSDFGGANLNITQPAYNEANLLRGVDIWLQQTGEPAALLPSTGATFRPITNVDYNEKAQRTLVDYGNGAITTYGYDRKTFRLTHLVTTRRSDGASLQDLAYHFDPVGNLSHLQDNSDIQNVVYFQNKRVEPSADYTYDAIYRLISATGREHLGLNANVPNAPTPPSYNDWFNFNLPHPNDGNAMGTYTETYTYDAVGNPQTIRHEGSAPASPGWTRSYSYAEASSTEPTRFSNRLSDTTVGANSEFYSYDLNGNIVRMPQLLVMQWDFKNQLQMTQRQAVNNSDQDGSNHQGERTYYLYDPSGQRIVKATESSAGAMAKQRIYLGSCEIYREYGSAAVITLERQSLHVTDDKRRVGLVEMRTKGQDGTPAQLVRLQFANHLESACLELDDRAEVITYEEYYPYGSTSYEAVTKTIVAAAKRYRYTGRERDEETGLEYCGARYFAPGIARWVSADPEGLVDGPNLYRYLRCSPTMLIDPRGTDPPDAKKNAFERNPDEHEEKEGEKVDESRDQQQNQLQDANFNAAATVPPVGTWTSEFGLFGFGAGGSPGASGGGGGFYHFRAVTGRGVEWGLLAGVGGSGPPSVGTGNLVLTLHLGQELQVEGLKYLHQHLTGWYFGAGFLWGQNPLIKPFLLSDAPQETGGWNTAGSAQFAYSYIRSEQKGKSTNIHQTFEFDFDAGVNAQRFGAINGVTVLGLVSPSLIFNVAWNDVPGDNWQLNAEVASVLNVGFGGAAQNQYQSFYGPGAAGIPLSLTESIGIGFQKAWGDYAFSVEPYGQHELLPNIANSGRTGGFLNGGWGGGIKFGFGGFNTPRQRRYPLP